MNMVNDGRVSLRIGQRNTVGRRKVFDLIAVLKEQRTTAKLVLDGSNIPILRLMNAFFQGDSLDANDGPVNAGLDLGKTGLMLQEMAKELVAAEMTRLFGTEGISHASFIVEIGKRVVCNPGDLPGSTTPWSMSPEITEGISSRPLSKYLVLQSPDQEHMIGWILCEGGGMVRHEQIADANPGAEVLGGGLISIETNTLQLYRVSNDYGYAPLTLVAEAAGAIVNVLPPRIQINQVVVEGQEQYTFPLA
jgi:hypothetical protein